MMEERARVELILKLLWHVIGYDKMKLEALIKRTEEKVREACILRGLDYEKEIAKVRSWFEIAVADREFEKAQKP